MDFICALLTSFKDFVRISLNEESSLLFFSLFDGMLPWILPGSPDIPIILILLKLLSNSKGFLRHISLTVSAKQFGVFICIH
jgi:hypothetical protein